MRLTVVRHGETKQNKAKIIQGHRPGELSELGETQARALAKRLSNLHFDSIYCSDLKRTKDTLAPLLEISQKQSNLTYTEAIREKCYGEFEDRPVDEFLKHLAEKHETRFSYRPKDGENYVDAYERGAQFIEKIRPMHESESVLIVSHGGFIRTLLAGLLGQPMDYFFRFPIQNTSISEVLIPKNKKTGVAVRINCLGHLSPSQFT